jgi:hypothetical protein
METVIVICLLIIIVLLLQDKIVIKKYPEQKPVQEKSNPNLPDIMGQPKPQRSLSVPMSTNESQKLEQEHKTDNFDIEIGEEKVDSQIAQEELDEVFGNVPDFEDEDEEEEWNSCGISDGDNGFAQGVTFEELSAVGMLLKKEKLRPSQKETAAVLLQKIQGTELFDLLENSIEDASQKIAKLLDGTLSSETDSGSSILHKKDLKDFDIGEFI